MRDRPHDEPVRTGQPRPRPTATRIAGLLAMVLVALVATGEAPAGEMRRVDGKGVTYPFLISGDLGLQADPGRNAWLEPWTDPGGSYACRLRSGLQWSYRRDSRVSEISGRGYIEFEPLDGRSFEEAADAFIASLDSLWEREGGTFERAGDPRKERGIRLGRTRVDGLRFDQEVRPGAGRVETVTTVLFPYADHLVAVSAWGRSDNFTPLLKDLEPLPRRRGRRPRAYNLVESLQQVGQHIRIELPPQLLLDPPVRGETPRERMARWVARAEDGTIELEVELDRVSVPPGGAEAADLLTRGLGSEAGGGAPPDISPLEIDDFPAASTYSEKDGVLVWDMVWVMPSLARHIRCRVHGGDEETRARRLEEIIELLVDETRVWAATMG